MRDEDGGERLLLLLQEDLDGEEEGRKTDGGMRSKSGWTDRSRTEREGGRGAREAEGRRESVWSGGVNMINPLPTSSRDTSFSHFQPH